MTAQIELLNGGVALVDAEDLPRLAGLRWRRYAPDKASPDAFYAMASKWFPERKRKATVWMHRFLLDCPRGMYVDHIDHNGLNNRRANLRVCTQSQNNANARYATNESGYRGVYRARSGRFHAHISVARRMKHLGTFDDAETAARAYDQRALETYGDFATLNFPARPQRHESHGDTHA